MKVATTAQMRAMDGYAVAHFGIPEEILMENAGLAAVAVLEREIGVAGKNFVIVCGMGNNGGDGLVVARQLHSRKGKVRVMIVGDPDRFRGAARSNYERLMKLPIDVRIVTEQDLRGRPFHGVDGIVDAIFGTGLDREVVGLHRAVIHAINNTRTPVISLDIPSGINGDTGNVMGVAVRAQATVTFGLPKVGNILYPGFQFGGRLYVSPISFPPSLYEKAELTITVGVLSPLPPRNPEGHKGSMGDCLVVAGAGGYYGAPFLAAMSFYRAGGGYCRLAAPRTIIGAIAVHGAELIFVPQAESSSGSISRENTDNLISLAEQVDIVVLGPGVSRDTETADLVRVLAGRIPKPLIIDGDGLTALVGHGEVLRGRTAPTILTPHPGEMARLTGLSVGELQCNRIDILRRTAAELKSIIVLKGPHSLVGYPDGRVVINISGNAGMATAGAGDVLTGTIAAMYGLGLPIAEAVAKGVYIHGRAGDIAAERQGMDGMTAGDILAALPAAVAEDRRGDAPGGIYLGKIIPLP
ncbi:MAG: NAD(P)H-hydrate dehydratase [Syntrophales bacterium]|nr:NAD(P)H-hydrate dehydratase [Syntrophales bacterium]